MSTDPLFMRQGTQYYWYHNDHLGTPQMMTTSSGAVVWKAKYTSFGKAAVDSASTVVNPLRFPGQYEDTETSLLYNWHRYFLPNIGRYIRNDPIGLKGGDINFYVYGSSSPIVKIDYSGKSAKFINCTEKQKERIKLAIEKINNSINKCISDKKERNRFAEELSRVTVNCVDWKDSINPRTGNPVCGFASGDFNRRIREKGIRKGPYDPHEIELTNNGINEALGCGRLEGIMAHEISHNIGYEHTGPNNAYELEKCINYSMWNHNVPKKCK